MTATQVQQLRLVAGFAVQPFVAAVVGFVSFPLIDLTRAEGHLTRTPVDAAIAIAMGAFFAAILVTPMAIPIAAWRMGRGPLTLGSTLVWGAALGNLPAALIVPMAIVTGNFVGGWDPVGLARPIAIGALFGMTGAAVFWLIAIRGGSSDASRTSSTVTLGSTR